MGVSIETQAFSGKEQAESMIAELGLVKRDGAMQSGDLEDVHWHKTSLRIYVLQGAFETRDVVSDTLMPAGPGDIISIPRETLHAARCPEPAVYVVGFESAEAMATFGPQDPADLPG